MSERSQRVAVLGAGISGLATAFDLENQAQTRGVPLRVSVFESSGTVGGKLKTTLDDGYVVEAGPNGWLDNEPATGRLLSRLGLEPETLRSEDAARHRFLYVRGKLRELPMSPPAFIKSDILSAASKLRVAAELLVPPRRNLGLAATDPSTDETIYEFGRRRLGRNFAELFLDPMVKGVFGGDARRVSLAAAFPRMVELEKNYGGLFKALMKVAREKKKNGNTASSPMGPSGILTSLAAGMGTLPQTLAGALRGDIHTAQPVTRVWRDDKGWWLRTEDDLRGPYDAVVDTTPAHAAANHMPDPELSSLLAGIPYAPMAVVTLAFDRSGVAHDLNGFGMLNPTCEKRRLLGVLWTTSIFQNRAPEGKVLLRCMAGGAANPGIMELTDEQLIQTCIEELGPLYGFRRDPERTWITRHRRAIAQYEAGHVARLRAVATILDRLPGLYLAGSSYRGVSVNHCIAEAERNAGQIVDDLETRFGGNEAYQNEAVVREATSGGGLS